MCTYDLLIPTGFPPPHCNVCFACLQNMWATDDYSPLSLAEVLGPWMQPAVPDADEEMADNASIVSYVMPNEEDFMWESVQWESEDDDDGAPDETMCVSVEEDSESEGDWEDDDVDLDGDAASYYGSEDDDESTEAPEEDDVLSEFDDTEEAPVDENDDQLAEVEKMEDKSADEEDMI